MDSQERELSLVRQQINKSRPPLLHQLLETVQNDGYARTHATRGRNGVVRSSLAQMLILRKGQ